MSLTTISLSRKRRADIHFLLLDMSSGIIVAEVYDAIALRSSPETLNHVVPITPQGFPRRLPHSRDPQWPAPVADGAFGQDRHRSFGSLPHGAVRVQCRSRHSVQGSP